MQGTIFTVQKALPLMGEGGSIIMTGSSCRHHGRPGLSAYSASKAALRNLARTWAEELKGTGIRVNVLSPGATATELAVKSATRGRQKSLRLAESARNAWLDPGRSERSRAFLASQDSSFMTAARSLSTAA